MNININVLNGMYCTFTVVVFAAGKYKQQLVSG